MPHNPQDTFAILARAFPEEAIQQKGKYDYVSHGLVTERLIQADPYFETRVEHVYTYNDERGVPHCAGVMMTLCLNLPQGEHGTQRMVCRTESGGPQMPAYFAKEMKDAQSDAIKRCAMRFGVALNIWEKLVDSREDEDYQKEITSGQIIALEHLRKTVAPKHRAWLDEHYPDFKSLSEAAADDMITRLQKTLEGNGTA